MRAREVILWLDKCNPDHDTANKVMLAIKNIFLLENDRPVSYDEYTAIIQSSGSAGIIKA